MLILIDLDGTILNSVHPTWKPYKDGQDNFRIDNYLDQLPFSLALKSLFKFKRKKVIPS